MLLTSFFSLYIYIYIDRMSFFITLLFYFVFWTASIIILLLFASRILCSSAYSSPKASQITPALMKLIFYLGSRGRTDVDRLRVFEWWIVSQFQTTIHLMIYVSNAFPHILFSIFLRLFIFIFIFVEFFFHYNKIPLLFLPLFIVPTQITLRAQTTLGDSI